MLAATLLVLAGGRSSRMGSPKALLPVGDQALVQWIIASLAPAFDEVLVSGPGSLLPPELRPVAVADLHPGAGPLAGLEAGLKRARHDTLVAVACDMPLVTESLARLLVRSCRGHDAAVPRPAGRPEPACAAYRRSALPTIVQSVAEGRLAARQALISMDVRYLGEAELAAAGADRRTFWSINTPEDYRQFLSRLGRGLNA